MRAWGQWTVTNLYQWLMGGVLCVCVCVSHTISNACFPTSTHAKSNCSSSHWKVTQRLGMCWEVLIKFCVEWKMYFCSFCLLYFAIPRSPFWRGHACKIVHLVHLQEVPVSTFMWRVSVFFFFWQFVCCARVFGSECCEDEMNGNYCPSRSDPSQRPVRVEIVCRLFGLFFLHFFLFRCALYFSEAYDSIASTRQGSSKSVCEKLYSVVFVCVWVKNELKGTEKWQNTDRHWMKKTKTATKTLELQMKQGFGVLSFARFCALCMCLVVLYLCRRKICSSRCDSLPWSHFPREVGRNLNRAIKQKKKEKRIWRRKLKKVHSISGRTETLNGFYVYRVFAFHQLMCKYMPTTLVTKQLKMVNKAWEGLHFCHL